MTPDERCATDSGIWPRQNCAKLVDNDAAECTVEILRGWRALAESTAKRHLERARDATADAPFRRVERDMPALLAEMRDDLRKHPLVREFILFQKNWVYNGTGRMSFTYFYEDHPDLDGVMHILQNRGAVRDITHNNVKRFVLTEPFVEYLIDIIT